MPKSYVQQEAILALIRYELFRGAAMLRGEDVPEVPNEPDPSLLIDLEEAAKLLGTTPNALKKRVYRGQFPRAAIYKTGRRIQFIRSKLPGAK